MGKIAEDAERAERDVAKAERRLRRAQNERIALERAARRAPPETKEAAQEAARKAREEEFNASTRLVTERQTRDVYVREAKKAERDAARYAAWREEQRAARAAKRGEEDAKPDKTEYWKKCAEMARRKYGG